MSQGNSGDGSQSMGITMLSVLLGLALTVAFGVKGEWWVRTLAGVAVFLALTAAIKLGTRRGRGRSRSSPSGWSGASVGLRGGVRGRRSVRKGGRPAKARTPGVAVTEWTTMETQIASVAAPKIRSPSATGNRSM